MCIVLFLGRGSIKQVLSIDFVIEIYDCVNIDFSQSKVNYSFLQYYFNKFKSVRLPHIA